MIDNINPRYEVRYKLGAGGMATIYLAKDKEDNDKHVVIKVIKFSGVASQNDKNKRRFLNEIKAYKKVKSPYVAEFIDCEFTEDMQYIVMEYVSGTTIRNILSKKTGIDPDQIQKWSMQMAEGFQTIHEANIIHRDIKNTNIMVTKEGNIKIIDFGIALTDESERVTEDHSVIGSPDYLPPEATYIGAKPSKKYDIYSLGILMYEMATGVKPYARPGASAGEIVKLHMEGNIVPAYKVKSKLPKSISNIIAKATAKRPGQRYLSMKALKLDMSSALLPNRIKEKPIDYNLPRGTHQKKESWFKENKFILSLITGGVILLVALVSTLVLLLK